MICLERKWDNGAQIASLNALFSPRPHHQSFNCAYQWKILATPLLYQNKPWLYKNLTLPYIIAFNTSNSVCTTMRKWSLKSTNGKRAFSWRHKTMPSSGKYQRWQLWNVWAAITELNTGDPGSTAVCSEVHSSHQQHSALNGRCTEWVKFHVMYGWLVCDTGPWVGFTIECLCERNHRTLDTNVSQSTDGKYVVVWGHHLMSLKEGRKQRWIKKWNKSPSSLYWAFKF